MIRSSENQNCSAVQLLNKHLRNLLNHTNNYRNISYDNLIDNNTDDYHSGRFNITENPFENDSVGFFDMMERSKMSYKTKHGQIGLAVSIFGLISNAMNIVVLTRRNMKSSVNAILVALAVADLMLLVFVQVKLRSQPTVEYFSTDKYTFLQAVLYLISRSSFIVSHAISSWLTVLVAIWRVMHVCYPASTTRCRSLRRARCAVLTIYVTCIIICTPQYLLYKIESFKDADGVEHNSIAETETSIKNYSLFMLTETWVFQVSLRILPCIALVALTLLLIRAICKADKSRDRLKMGPGHGRGRRTTAMLVVILVIFFLANISPAISFLLFHLDVRYAMVVYKYTLQTMELLILVNSAVNFIVYCSMSAEFRKTFVATFLKPWKRNLNYLSPTSSTQTSKVFSSVKKLEISRG